MLVAGALGQTELLSVIRGIWGLEPVNKSEIQVEPMNFNNQGHLTPPIKRQHCLTLFPRIHDGYLSNQCRTSKVTSSLPQEALGARQESK